MLVDWTRTNHEFRLSLDDRLDQRFNVTRIVLVVGVGIDDDVGTVCEGGIQTRDECRSQAPIGWMGESRGSRPVLVRYQRCRRLSHRRLRASTLSHPGMARGSATSFTGSESASLKHGTWMISFI